MGGDPVLCDGQAGSDPDALVFHDIVEQPLEAHRAGGVADQTHVQPDRQHPGLSPSLTVEHVETVLDEGEPRIGRPDPAGILAVVVGEGVGHDEVPAPGDRYPVRQLVVVGIRVVEEAAFLYEEGSRVDAGTIPAVPAERPGPEGGLERCDGSLNVLTLGLARELGVLDPSPAVTAHVEPRLPDGVSRRPVAFEREGAREHSEGQLALLEQAQQTPEADPAPVLEHALGGEVAAPAGLPEAVRLGEPDLGGRLAIRHRRLRALLVVHDEVESEAGAIRPPGIGWVCAVTNEVPRVAFGHHVRSYAVARFRRRSASHSARRMRETTVSGWPVMASSFSTDHSP